MSNRERLRELLSANRKSVLSVVITVSLVASLVAFAAPTAAVSSTLTGPDEVGQTERGTLTATVDIGTDERIPVDAFVLEFQPSDGDDSETVAITFAPNGTVLDVTPASGVVGEGEIRVQLLRNTLEIEPIAQDPPFDSGPRVADDPSAGEERDFGYGYGYTNESQTDFQYEITFDSRAFKQGDYTAQLSVDTGAELAFTSESLPFDVTVPADDRGPDGDRGPPEDRGPDGDRGPPADRGPAQLPTVSSLP